MVSRLNATTFSLVVGLWGVLGSSTARADERAVLQRLKTYGDLSAADARSVVEKVTERMKLAADLSSSGDPLRVAVSTALYDSATAADPAATSMVRLRLYAGLTEWALDRVFSSRRAVSEVCAESGLEVESCRALLAAGQSVPFEDISPIRLRVAKREPEPAPAAAPQYAAAEVRWPRSQPVRADQEAPMPAARVAAPAVAAPATVAPAAAAAAATRPAPATRAQPSRVEVAQRKADYAAQRQAYLDRRRQEMETRKAKLLATAGGERAKRGPASEQEAEVVGLSRGSAKSEEPHALVAARTENGHQPQAHEKSGDSDLFEGLMDDPLGKH